MLPDHPVIVGHRGFGRSFNPIEPVTHKFVENTAASFAQAATMGAEWIELDVVASKEGELFLWHSHHHDGIPLHLVSSKQLEDAGIEKVSDFADSLPTHIGIDVEVKTLPLNEQRKRHGEEAIIDYVADLGRKRPVLWTSFDPVVTQVGASAGAPIGWISRQYWPLHEAVMATINLGAEVLVVHGHTTLEDGNPLNTNLGWELATKHGIQVWAWDVEVERIPEHVSNGVIGFCTDYIQAAAQQLRTLAAA